MSRGHRWTPADDAFMKANYPTKSAQEIAKHIGVTELAARNRATTLHLRKMKRITVGKHSWTPDELDYVRAHYQGTFASCQEIARQLNCSPLAVRGKVSGLGLGKVTDYRKNWTEEEERLYDLAQTYCPLKVARMMHRSVNAVTVRMRRLNISRRIRNGWLNKTEVCEILGKEHKWVQARIDRGDLKASYHHLERPSSRGMREWHIWEEDLAAFIRNHARELDGRCVDLQAVVWTRFAETRQRKRQEGRDRGFMSSRGKCIVK